MEKEEAKMSRKTKIILGSILTVVIVLLIILLILYIGSLGKLEKLNQDVAKDAEIQGLKETTNNTDEKVETLDN